jgi:hypothetical protein
MAQTQRVGCNAEGRNHQCAEVFASPASASAMQLPSSVSLIVLHWLFPVATERILLILFVHHELLSPYSLK